MATIEDVKNFWDNRPCNIRHSSKKIGTKEYFDEVEKKKYFVEPHILDFADFHKWKNKKVLEVGCGIGTDSISFAKVGANITCFDLSEQSLDLCKKRFEVNKLNANFYLGDAENLSQVVPNEIYDLIYSFGVIHHTPNPKRILNEIKKFMNSETEVRIMLYSKYSWKSLESFLRYGYKFNFNFKKTIQWHAEAQCGCPVAFVYSKNEIKKLLTDFDVLKIEKKHIFPYIVELYVKNIFKKRLIFRVMPNYIFDKLESILGWHTLVTFKKK